MSKKKVIEKPGREELRFPETAAPMRGAAFGEALDKLQIGRSAFARLIGVGGRTVRAWFSEDFPVPMPVGYLVSLMVKTKTDPDDLKIL